MLPRTGLQLKPKVQLQSETEERENTKALVNRMNNSNKPKVISANNKQRVSPKPQNSPPHPQPQRSQRRNSSAVQNVISTVNNATSLV